MPPAAKRRLPFKPPRPVSNATAPTSKAAGKEPVAQRSRASNASTSTRTSINNTTIISSDEDVDEDEDMSDASDRNNTTTFSNRRSTITSRRDLSTPRRQSTAILHATEYDDPAAAILAEDEDAPTVPRALLTRLLHEGFEDKNVKIGKEAMSVVEMYLRVFVKEAIARSREEGREKGDVDDGWLQVEDLEKVAPQLMLDF
jgi:hypothetical protein